MASQTIVGPDLQYTQDNLRCYAYSGIFTIGSSSAADNTALNFTSGTGYISAKLQITLGDNGGSNAYMDIKLNGIAIVQNKWDDSGSSAVTLDSPILFIIPPFTDVEILIGSANAGTIPMGATLTGRVHEYLPVRN